MNTLDEKSNLWDTLVSQKIFKEEVPLNISQQLFESLIIDVDKRSISLPEKKEIFLKEYEELMNKEARKKRDEWFESRLNKKLVKPPPSMKELNEIKQLLYKILEKIESL
jgi:hypothetical protein